MSENRKERIQTLCADRLETLSEDLLDFTRAADLNAWPIKHWSKR